jgi:hypothetical protein
VLADAGTLFSRDKVRALLAGRVPAEELEAKTQALLDAAVTKRLAAGQTVVVALDGLDAAEREHFVRLAAAHRRPRHLILVETGKANVAEEDRGTLDALRTALDAGEMGQEGFVTSLRLGGRTIGELNRIVFAPPPKDD